MIKAMEKHLKILPLIMLVLIVVLMGDLAWSEEPHAKVDKELITLGQKIDKAAALADSSRVTFEVVDKWSGTTFTFDATSTPRSLTAQDIQNLRANGMGYGEISILLALTANQPNPTTAKSLNEILALHQSGSGWGELARELGYRNLGSVVKSVKTTEKDIVQGARPMLPEEQRKAIQKPDRVEPANRGRDISADRSSHGRDISADRGGHGQDVSADRGGHGQDVSADRGSRH